MAPTIDLSTFELNNAMRTTAAALLAACAELKEWAQSYATAHSDYKREWAMTFLGCELKTDGQRKAKADEVAADLLCESDLAEGMQQAQLELVRSLRANLSSLQSEAKGNVEESQYYRTGPQFEK